MDGTFILRVGVIVNINTLLNKAGSLYLIMEKMMIWIIKQ